MQLVDFEIFQPNYLVAAECNLRESLLREAVRDGRSEAFRRAFLLSVSPEEQTRIMEKRASNIFESIISLVDGIIDPQQATALRTDLQAFIKLSCTVWRAIQRLQDRFEPNMDHTVDASIDWLTLPLEGDESSTTDQSSSTGESPDDAVLVVFPRMYIAKNAEPKPVTSGVVLMRSQTLIAAQEARSEASTSPTFGRGAPVWSRGERRRDSIVMTDSLATRNVAPFLGQGAPNGQLH